MPARRTTRQTRGAAEDEDPTPTKKTVAASAAKKRGRPSKKVPQEEDEHDEHEEEAAPANEDEDKDDDDVTPKAVERIAPAVSARKSSKASKTSSKAVVADEPVSPTPTKRTSSGDAALEQLGRAQRVCAASALLKD